jgi:excisionase family DNA binding protein
VNGLIQFNPSKDDQSSPMRFSFSEGLAMSSLLLTPEEAAAELRIGRSRMYDLIKRGEVVSVRVGGSRRVLRDSLATYVQNLVAAQSTGPADAI